MSAEEARRLIATPFVLIQPERMRWMWRGKVPIGTVTANIGKGGIGKTTFELWQIARATRGELDGDWYGHPITALIVTPEDDPGAVTRPRLQAAGADLDRVFNLTVDAVVDGITRERRVKLPLDVEQLSQTVAETGAQLLFIDGMTTAFEGSTDSKEDMRAALDPLIDLAQKRGIVVIVTHHSRKGNGNLSDLISGSHAIRDAVRSVLFFVKDDDTDEVIVTQEKNNYAADSTSSKFRIVSAVVDTNDGPTSVGTVEWLGDSDISAADLIAKNNGGDDLAESGEVANWLRWYLADMGGSAPRKDILKAARSEGISEKVLRRAREKTGLITARQGFPSTTVWMLPEAESAQSGPVVPSQAHAPYTGTTGHDRARLETEGELCTVCGEPMSPAIVADGYTTHPGCEPPSPERAHLRAIA